MEYVQSAWKIRIPKAEIVDGAAIHHIGAVLSLPPKYYRERILKIGFIGKNTRLLDAGCGAGHWSIVASFLNQEVKGVDSTAKYLDYAFRLNRQFRRKNLEFRLAKIEKLPFKNAYFDYVICYDAWMYTNKEKTLQEFQRVLKPRGKLYLADVAGLGWYLNLIWQAVREGNRGLLLIALKAIKSQIHTYPKDTVANLKKYHFNILGFGPDGSLGDAKIQIHPTLPAKKFGFWNAYEVLAEKIIVRQYPSKDTDLDFPSEKIRSKRSARSSR